jgi:hypothetical protein
MHTDGWRLVEREDGSSSSFDPEEAKRVAPNSVTAAAPRVRGRVAPEQ